jgi:Tfp pilus assembly protein PilF
MTHFNLGCYACQLGDIDQAKERVRRSIELDAKFKMLALDDPDLEPLWKEIEEAK